LLGLTLRTQLLSQLLRRLAQADRQPACWRGGRWEQA
jgi:hypothetical protein